MIIINYWAVLAAAVAMFIVGAIWYMPLFGRVWMRYMDTIPNNARTPRFSMPASMVVTFLVNVVYAYVLAIVMGLANPSSALAAAAFGFMVAAGFVVTMQINAVLFEKRPMYAFGIVAGANLLTSIVGALVLYYV